MSALQRLSKRLSRRNLYPWLREAIVTHGVADRACVLNVGAGGDIAEEIARCNVRATSVDADPARGPDLVADVQDLATIADGTVDAVFLMEVLEHVARPHVAVAELRRVLRPGGIVVGSTPFILEMHDQPGDYFRFTLHGLRLLFREFEMLSLRERNGYFAAIAALLLRPYASGSEARRRRARWLSPLLVPLALLVQVLDRALPSLDATTGYFFVVRKPEGGESRAP